ncbi:unnamed protein product, partial [Acidithrix sp. C25]
VYLDRIGIFASNGPNRFLLLRSEIYFSGFRMQNASALCALRFAADCRFVRLCLGVTTSFRLYFPATSGATDSGGGGN